LSRTGLKRTCGLCVIVLVLNACTSVSTREPFSDKHLAYRDRAEKLQRISGWTLTGKISLDDGDHGGSGHLRWEVQQENSQIDFHAALGRGAWHLQINPGSATLKEANGVEQTAPRVDGLIQARMGWSIPVEALQSWLLGLAAPGAGSAIELDPEGLLISLQQLGWTVNFSRYETVTGVKLPKRLNAKRDNYRVKLVIRNWYLEN